MALGGEPLRVGRVSEHGGRQMRPADRLPGRLARLDRRGVDRVPERPQPLRHRVGAALAVRPGVLQPLAEQRAAVVDPVAEHMQVLVLPVDRRDLGCRHDPHAMNGTGGKRLVDPIDGVVIGKREQLHARRSRVLDNLGGR